MEIQQSHVIDGVVVEKIASFSGLNVFSHEPDDDRTSLFFCDQKGKVVQKLLIAADCIQNCGFISDLDFMNVD